MSKNINFILLVLLIAFASCNNLKSDAKTFYDFHIKYTDLGEEYSSDYIITEDEAKNLNEIKRNINELHTKIYSKINDNDELKFQWNEYSRMLNSELIIDRYIEVSFKLYECEGANQLD